MFPLSILDLVLVTQGSNPGQALRQSLKLAQHAEALDFTRYWVAEHHNMPGIASAATSVVLGFLAHGTERIRLGAGGVMLPNHSPLVIAEQFGTLAALYPGRIDLGLGRAPGTDPLTMRYLRRNPASADEFPQDVQELQALFEPAQPGQAVQAVPGAGTRVPLWILGSSLFGAKLAAELGLPYAFASHFAPQALFPAIELYRREFRPSAQLKEPYVIAGVNVYLADTEQEAVRLGTSQQQAFANLFRGKLNMYQPPVDDIDSYWTPSEKQHASQMLKYTFVGDKGQVAAGLSQFIEQTRVDELMVVSAIYDLSARLHSYELLAEIRAQLPGA